jgi:hypothetical protein
MSMQGLGIFGAMMFAASTMAAHAGPCAIDIDRVQMQIDARLEAAAAKGPTASQSVAAQMHRQPTPSSIAAAESRIGDMTPAAAEAIKVGMLRAREADGKGDKAACEKSLADVRRALEP